MILFVCHANLNRSPRAAALFRRLAEGMGLDVEVISAGITSEPHFDSETLKMVWGIKERIKLTNDLLHRAELVFVLDKRVLGEIVHNFSDPPEGIINLGIPDHFSLSRGNFDEFDRILEERLTPELNKLTGKERL